MTEKLISLQESYRQWRSKTKTGRVPSYLKKQTISLSRTHSVVELSQRIDIDSDTILSWIEKPSKPRQENIFIDLPAPSPHDVCLHEHQQTVCDTIQSELELTLPNSMSLKIKNKSTTEVVVLLRALVEGLKP